MQEVQIISKDDLDHSLLADETVLFGWRGQDFEIDLTAGHVEEFETFMLTYIQVARKVKQRKRRKDPVAVAQAAAQAAVNGHTETARKSHRSAAQQEAGAQRDRIREWAGATDWTDTEGQRQSRVGRLKQAVIDAYFVEHKDETPVL